MPLFTDSYGADAGAVDVVVGAVDVVVGADVDDGQEGIKDDHQDDLGGVVGGSPSPPVLLPPPHLRVRFRVAVCFLEYRFDFRPPPNEHPQLLFFPPLFIFGTIVYVYTMVLNTGRNQSDYYN